MGLEFISERVLEGDIAGEIESIEPRNPFLTRAYADSRISAGWEAWVLGTREIGTGRIEAACIGFLKKGTVSCGLEIPSLPDLQRESPFWEGLLEFGRSHNVTDIGLNSFASDSVSIPVFAFETTRRKREEYVIDLADEPRIEDLAKNHRRNIRKAQRAGLQIRTSTAPGSASQHALLVGESADRRRDRGEDTAGQPVDRVFSGLLRSGAALVCQAVDGDVVVSSVLLLTAEKSTYYHSAGTSPHGMSLGASPFLIFNLAKQMRSEGHETFNLGGADASQLGLVRFKSGFNARRVELESANWCMQSRTRREFIKLARSLKTEPLAFLRRLLPR